jgi:hypothetical protein
MTFGLNQSEQNNVAVRFRDRNDIRIERQKTNLSFKGGVKQLLSIFSRRLDGPASLRDGIGLASIALGYHKRTFKGFQPLTPQMKGGKNYVSKNAKLYLKA